jgi:hypothetical protein
MTEREFIQYCTELHGNRKRYQISSPERNLKLRLQKEALDILMQNNTIWYEYWQLQINDDFKSLLKKINWKRGSTRTVLLMFLAKLKTISKIVPREKDDNSFSELQEAYEVWKKFFGTKTSELETEDVDDILVLRTKIEKNIKFSSRTSIFAASWHLLEFWTENYRMNCLNEIKKRDETLQTTKNFFNLIFCHSIEQLTKRLYDVSS